MARSDGAFLYQISISNGGVPKRPVDQAHISYEGVAGDTQRNRVVHGGVNRAVCLYSLERIEALREEGHTIHAGASGENLTICGLDWASVKPGQQWCIGQSVRIELTSYTEPCRHNAQWFRDQNYTRISQKSYPGWSRLYAKVLAEGTVHRGDRVLIEVRKPLEKPA